MLLQRSAAMLKAGVPFAGKRMCSICMRQLLSSSCWGICSARPPAHPPAVAPAPFSPLQPHAPCPPADVRQQLFDLIEIAYLRAGLLDATPQQEGGLAAVEALLASRGGGLTAAGGPRGPAWEQDGLRLCVGHVVCPPLSELHPSPSPLLPRLPLLPLLPLPPNTQSGGALCRTASGRRNCFLKACCALTATACASRPTWRPLTPRSS